MATILEGLNQISAKLGGPADATNNAEAVANIADHASGGSGGGGDVVFVPFTNEKVNLGPAEGYVSTKTFAEIKQILDSGKVVLTRYPDATGVNPAIFAFVLRAMENDGHPTGIRLEGKVTAGYIPESVSAEYAGRVAIAAK